jgi:hypothetical protein
MQIVTRECDQHKIALPTSPTQSISNILKVEKDVENLFHVVRLISKSVWEF